MTVIPAAAACSTSSSGLHRPSDAVVCRWRSVRLTPRRSLGGSPSRVEGSPRAHACGGGRRGSSAAAGAALTLDERAVLANQQIEVIALLVGELEEDLLAFRVLEPLAILLEEAVRPALAADPDHQRLLIVDAAHQPFRAFGEQAVRGALEEEERRPRFELWITAQQLGVAGLE